MCPKRKVGKSSHFLGLFVYCFFSWSACWAGEWWKIRGTRLLRAPLPRPKMLRCRSLPNSYNDRHLPSLHAAKLVLHVAQKPTIERARRPRNVLGLPSRAATVRMKARPATSTPTNPAISRCCRTQPASVHRQRHRPAAAGAALLSSLKRMRKLLNTCEKELSASTYVFCWLGCRSWRCRGDLGRPALVGRALAAGSELPLSP